MSCCHCQIWTLRVHRRKPAGSLPSSGSDVGAGPSRQRTPGRGPLRLRWVVVVVVDSAVGPPRRRRHRPRVERVEAKGSGSPAAPTLSPPVPPSTPMRRRQPSIVESSHCPSLSLMAERTGCPGCGCDSCSGAEEKSGSSVPEGGAAPAAPELEIGLDTGRRPDVLSSPPLFHVASASASPRVEEGPPPSPSRSWAARPSARAGEAWME